MIMRGVSSKKRNVQTFASPHKRTVSKINVHFREGLYSGKLKVDIDKQGVMFHSFYGF